jgi:RND family efflux transporter MFP subunit
MDTSQTNLNTAHENGMQPLPPTQQPISRWFYITLGTAAILLGVVIYAGIHERAFAQVNLGQATERAAVPAVTVIHPKPNVVTQEIVLPGNTQAFSDTPIYARTNGYLKRWYFDIGAHVRQGQLLAEIETPEVDRQLEQARADLKTAQANEELATITTNRWQNLLKTNAVSKQETDQTISDQSARRATVDSMTANVHRLEQLQSFEKVYAPFTGVITARNTDIGALIDAGAGAAPKELFHMAAVDRLRIYVAVPEVDSSAAQTGAKANLTLDEFPGETFQGTIVRDSDSIDLTSRTLNVEVDVDSSRGRIKTGAYVFVHLKMPEGAAAASQSLVIPANTLLFRSEGLRVSVARDSHAELIPITIGRDYGSTVEVTAGLKPSDQVIINPSDSLTSGTPIQVSVAETGGTK